MPFYQLKVVTPQGIAYTNEVRHSRVPSDNGSVGILANHAPYVTYSAGGRLEIDDKNGDKKTFIVGPGFFTVAKNLATLLTDSFKS